MRLSTDEVVASTDYSLYGDVEIVERITMFGIGPTDCATWKNGRQVVAVWPKAENRRF